MHSCIRTVPTTPYEDTVGGAQMVLERSEGGNTHPALKTSPNRVGLPCDSLIRGMAEMSDTTGERYSWKK